MTMVLDYLRWTSVQGTLDVPPFHTGHLAFIPETEVTVALLRARSATQQHGCEICITPFDIEPQNLFTLKCVMVDQPGVVEKLIKAVASLKINIVTEESSSIDDLSRHEVFMLLDWSTSDMTVREPISDDLRNRFAELHAVLQTNDRRYFRLLERILAFCGDILDWTPSTPSVPNIQMHPLDERRDVLRRDQSIIKRHESKPLHVTLSLPDNILRHIEDATGWSAREKLAYVIMSDTDSRTLRVFFPRRGKERRLLRVALAHVDRPGALSAITETIAASNFSIVNSLIRRERFRESVWEALLEYKDQEDVPADAEQMIQWFRDHLKVAPHTESLLKYFEVSLGQPRYPRRPGGREGGVVLPLFDATADVQPQVAEQIGEAIDSLYSMKHKIDHADEFKHRRWLFESLVSLIRSKPSIFMSYPASAQIHADVLKSYLQKDYELVDYQTADLHDLRFEVKQRTARADFFLGIWHSEPTRPGDISPWLPFEFGIASALNKPAAIIVSKNVSQSVWMRIQKDTAIPQYEDVTFERATVPLLVDYCKHNWSAD